jgi:hypothetical protein
LSWIMLLYSKEVKRRTGTGFQEIVVENDCQKLD